MKLQKILIIIMFIGFSLVVIGVFVDIVNSNSNNNTEMKEVEEINDSNIPDDEYNTYYSDIMQKINYFDLYFSSTYPLDNIQDLEDKDKTLFALNILSGLDQTEITFDQVNEELGKYFLNYNVYTGDVISTDNTLLYKYTDNYFTKEFNEKNDECTFYTEIVNNELDNDFWVLSKKMYYIKSTKEDENYNNVVYSTYNDCLNDKNEVFSFNDEDYVLVESDYDKIKDKLKVLSYVFQKVNDKYYLKQVKVE